MAEPTDEAAAFGATTAEVEGAKLVHDTLRQLTTLGSGSILIMATLLDRVASQPMQRWRVRELRLALRRAAGGARSPCTDP